MKKIILSIFVLSVMLLFGCAEINLDCGVDDKYNAYIKYDINMDLNSMTGENRAAIQNEMKKVVLYYRDTLHFTVNKESYEDNEVIIEMEYTVPSDNYVSAFGSLKDILYDPKLSPFLNVDMSCISTDYESAFTFSATADIAQILKYADTGTFQNELQDIINAGLASSKGEITLRLPGTNVTESSGEYTLDGFGCTEKATLAFNGPTNMKLATRLRTENGNPVSDGNDVYINDLQSSINSNNTLIYTLIGGATASVVIIAALIFIKGKTRNT